jgi:hypothetical protein
VAQVTGKSKCPKHIGPHPHFLQGLMYTCSQCVLNHEHAWKVMMFIISSLDSASTASDNKALFTLERLRAMLDQYIGEWIVSKNPLDRYQNCNTSQTMILGGYQKM